MEDPKALYKEFVAKGMHPKDAAKRSQELTGLSVVTGKPINRQLYKSFSKRFPHKVIGQYGSS